jgi:group I intron endonuclease
MFLYKIENTVDKKLYAGITNDIKRRWREHRSDLNRGVHGNPHLQFAWNKYGEQSFNIEIIGQFEDMESLCKAEIDFIEQNNLKNQKNGYNLADGGAGTFKHTEEAKSKISKSNQKAVICKCLKTGKETVYDKMLDVTRDGFNNKSISSACTDRTLTYRKHVWMYLDEYIANPVKLADKFNNRQNTKSRPVKYKKVYGMNISSHEIIEYDAVYHTLKDGFSHQAVHKCCVNPSVNKSHRGYVWSFDKNDLLKKYKKVLNNKTHKVAV